MFDRKQLVKWLPLMIAGFGGSIQTATGNFLLGLAFYILSGLVYDHFERED